MNLIQHSKSIKIYSINGIKVDLVNYPYDWLSDMVLVEGIRLAHPDDIGAMKLAAISGRGSKKKSC